MNADSLFSFLRTAVLFAFCVAFGVALFGSPRGSSPIDRINAALTR